MSSANCRREVAAARQCALPLVRVHDADPAKNGAPLAVLRAACPVENRDFLLREAPTEAAGGNFPILPWHRLAEFQRLVLALIAEQLLLAAAWAAGATHVTRLPLSVPGTLAWARPTLCARVALYVSPHNPEAVEAAKEIGRLLSDVQLVDTLPVDGASPEDTAQRVRSRGFSLRRLKSRAASQGQVLTNWGALRKQPSGDDGRFLRDGEKAAAASRAVWLLFLTPTCFMAEAGEKLAAEVAAALQRGVRPLMLYSPNACEFREIIDATPPELLRAGLFGLLAIEWRDGALRAVSERLAAKALGARMGHGACEAASARLGKCVAGVAVAWTAVWRRNAGMAAGRVRVGGESRSGQGGALELTHNVVVGDDL